MRCIPFMILHLGCLGVIWVGISPLAVGVAVALYFVRMFAVTGIYHRYFSHKTYSTSRVGQFLLALFAATTVQRGALWWAYHHRHHHRHSDDPEDVHSPHVHGFLWSHIGWITSRRNFPTDYTQIKDLAKYPELVFLNRFDTLVPALLALVTLGEGWHNNHHRYQASARNGFYWWELDITYYSLKVLSWTRLIWNLKPVPQSVLEEGERAEHHASIVASRRADVVQADYSTLKRALPAAAAFAVATVQAAHGAPPVKPIEPPSASQTEHGT